MESEPIAIITSLKEGAFVDFADKSTKSAKSSSCSQLAIRTLG